jgi:hypothetical protein
MKNTNVYKYHKAAVKMTAALLFLLIFSGCGRSPATATAPSNLPTNSISPTPEITTPTPFFYHLTINPDEALQTLRDVGAGNFIHRFGGVSEATDPISEMNLKVLSPTLARVSVDLDIWEPANDNDDPFVMTPDAFIDSPGSSLHATMLFLQEFKQRTPDALLIGSVWIVPNWMVKNPDFEQGQLIPPENVPEAIESIAAWLLHAKEQYGVEVDYVSFNEANLGIRVLLTTDEYISFIQQGGKRFKELGLKTKWLLGDASNMKETAPYASAIYAEPGVRPYLGPLSFHSWDETTSDPALQAIANLAESNNLEVWCTEGGWNPSLWQRPDDFPLFNNALHQAIIYTRVLKLARATSLLYWEMMGGDYRMNDGEKPYPILSFMERLKREFPPGTQIVATSEDPQNLKFTAGKAQDGFVVLLVNRNPIKEEVRLDGLPDGNYNLMRSSRDEQNELIWSQEINGSVLLEIAANSINFLTTRAP